MTKEEFLQLGLSDELAAKAAASSAEELKQYVAKTEHETLKAAKENLDKQVAERDKQLEILKKSAGDTASLQKKIDELQEANKTAKAEYESTVKRMKLDFAVDDALTKMKAKNNKAVRALLELDGLEVGEDGKVSGLDKQLEKLAKGDDTKFLFDAESEGAGGKPRANVFGMTPQGPSGGKETESAGAMFAAKYNSMIMPAAQGAAQ